MVTKYRQRASLGLNLTPLIDIIFLLLVFFMLTAHFVEERALDVELPTSEANTLDIKKPQVEIIIGTKGQVLVNGLQVPINSLEKALRQILHSPGPKTVRLRGDRKTNLELAVQAMDAARRAGARSLDIMTQKP
ncbi:hypothetical protein TI05_18795 [Achromatium sp. WMS3]|nr:hypothetical protein TI05_18795 [Achromatium sp. WMS3]